VTAVEDDDFLPPTTSDSSSITVPLSVPSEDDSEDDEDFVPADMDLLTWYSHKHKFGRGQRDAEKDGLAKGKLSGAERNSMTRAYVGSG